MKSISHNVSVFPIEMRNTKGKQQIDKKIVTGQLFKETGCSQ